MRGIVTGILLTVLCTGLFAAQYGPYEFMETALKNDAYFEMLLAEEMKIKYKTVFSKANGDLLASVRGSYSYLMPDAHSDYPEQSYVTVSLSKLFPEAGAGLSATYTASKYGGAEFSSALVSLALPVVRNAFGMADRMAGEIADYAEEVAFLQAAESYEDYMAQILRTYYAWYSDYALLQAGLAAVTEAEKLYDNMKERKRSGIAYESDVQKSKIQLAEKKISAAELELKYLKSLNLMKLALNDSDPVPAKPAVFEEKEVPGTAEEIFASSRAGRIINTAVKKAGVSESKAFNMLLPDISLRASLQSDGQGYALSSNSNLFTAGFSASLPVFTSERDINTYEIEKLEARRLRAAAGYGLKTYLIELENLKASVETRKKAAVLASEKEAAAEAVLKEERKNYGQARINLNDLINAINTAEQARFARISAEAALSSAIIDYRRQTDTLVVKGPENKN